MNNNDIAKQNLDRLIRFMEQQDREMEEEQRRISELTANQQAETERENLESISLYEDSLIEEQAITDGLSAEDIFGLCDSDMECCDFGVEIVDWTDLPYCDMDSMVDPCMDGTGNDPGLPFAGSDVAFDFPDMGMDFGSGGFF